MLNDCRRDSVEVRPRNRPQLSGRQLQCYLGHGRAHIARGCRHHRARRVHNFKTDLGVVWCSAKASDGSLGVDCSRRAQAVSGRVARCRDGAGDSDRSKEAVGLDMQLGRRDQMDRAVDPATLDQMTRSVQVDAGCK